MKISRTLSSVGAVLLVGLLEPCAADARRPATAASFVPLLSFVMPPPPSPVRARSYRGSCSLAAKIGVQL
jgi:hypothetical protein